MPVIAVINRKGGSGKSTLATHLAAYCARNGMPVMLGDVDRQQSAQAWLKLRRAQQLPELAPIVGWTVDPRNTLRPPAGISRVVLDTPGGMRGFELARVVMSADAILMPVCNSVFDRESAAQCYAELLTLPRVASGRCKVAAVGMRLDARTKATEVLQLWADANRLPFIAVLRETQAYVRCVEQGLTLFDLPPQQTEADMAQWKPIVDWLLPVLQPAAADSPAARPQRRAPDPVVAAKVAEPAPRAAAPRPRPAEPARPHSTIQRIGSLLGRLGVPGFPARAPARSRAVAALPWADSTRPVKAP